MVPWVCLQFVIAVIPYHNTHYFCTSLPTLYIIFIPAFFLRKNGILILYQSWSVVRLSMHVYVRTCVRFLLTVYLPKPLAVETSNFVAA